MGLHQGMAEINCYHPGTPAGRVLADGELAAFLGSPEVTAGRRGNLALPLNAAADQIALGVIEPHRMVPAAVLRQQADEVAVAAVAVALQRRQTLGRG